MDSLNRTTGSIIEAAIAIHRRLGPGLFESAYEQLLASALTRQGLDVQRQVMIPFNFDGETIEYGFRVDLLVAQQIIVEIKSTDRPAPIHRRQLLTYVKLMQRPIGLLINFGAERLIDGVQRVVNGYEATH